jgi:hypothetical protein
VNDHLVGCYRHRELTGVKESAGGQDVNSAANDNRRRKA